MYQIRYNIFLDYSELSLKLDEEKYFFMLFYGIYYQNFLSNILIDFWKLSFKDYYHKKI